MAKILIWTGALGGALSYQAPLDGAIRFLTHGRGTHAAFLRADGATVHEAFWPRVRDRALTDDDIKSAQAFELDGVAPYDHAKFEALFDANLRKGIKYSIEDLFRFALNMPSKDESHTFCSRYVLHCCTKVLHPLQMPLVRIPGGDWASPRDLLISPRLIVVKLSLEKEGATLPHPCPLPLGEGESPAQQQRKGHSWRIIHRKWARRWRRE